MSDESQIWLQFILLCKPIPIGAEKYDFFWFKYILFEKNLNFFENIGNIGQMLEKEDITGQLPKI